MTDLQWQDLLRVIGGELLDPLPVGLIVDSPWLPGWAGVSMLDYFADEQVWLEANLRAVRRFEGISLLPGFWMEYGMCTEPSAFGAKCTWYEDTFPSAERPCTITRRSAVWKSRTAGQTACFRLSCVACSAAGGRWKRRAIASVCHRPRSAEYCLISAGANRIPHRGSKPIPRKPTGCST